MPEFTPAGSNLFDHFERTHGREAMEEAEATSCHSKSLYELFGATLGNIIPETFHLRERRLYEGVAGLVGWQSSSHELDPGFQVSSTFTRKA